MKEESVNLFYREGSSDKVYHAYLKQDGSGYRVTFAYGRRGTSLTPGTKTTLPVAYGKAKAIYDKLVSEKKGKGYVEDSSGKPIIQHVDKTDSGHRPQLLNPIDESELIKYLEDDSFIAQEKFDGKRRILDVNFDGRVDAINRKGLVVGISDIIIQACSKIGTNVVLDGEEIGDVVHIFDTLSLPKKYIDRYIFLKNLENRLDKNVLKIVPTAFTTQQKYKLYQKLVQENAEGIVFKKASSLYSPGRPNSYGDQLKFKFYSTASCIVIGHHSSKSSIELAVYSNGVLIPVGNVTVYPNQEFPKVDSVVEVRYLYYYPSGSLYQPILLGLRDDIEPNECLITKLKTKQVIDDL
jgi:bifunctional non-homologous end joining protein LigD